MKLQHGLIHGGRLVARMMMLHQKWTSMAIGIKMDIGMGIEMMKGMAMAILKQAKRMQRDHVGEPGVGSKPDSRSGMI